MRRWKLALIAIILIAVTVTSVFLTENLVGPKPKPQFYVGVEFAYAYNNQTSMESFVHQLESLVDKVKGYTNLFVIGSPDITFNQTALNECCDYITRAGLSLIVLFTDQRMYTTNNNPFTWIQQAPAKYGDKFLAVYRFDEPGGNQLDNGTSRIIYQADSLADAAANYTFYYKLKLSNWQVGEKIVTADYGLYWWDYKSGFDMMLCEYGNNQSQLLSTALCRGAAQAQGKTWGAIVTWTYSHPPYIESGSQLLSDLKLAYDAGAEYAVVFDYPGNLTQYGILTEDHFAAMQSFWSYIQSNPQRHGEDKATAAYVMPQDYAFGFRRESDTVWGIFSNATLSGKIWNDTNSLLNRYGDTLNIIYDDPAFNSALSRYTQVYYYNQTVT